MSYHQKYEVDKPKTANFQSIVMITNHLKGFHHLTPDSRRYVLFSLPRTIHAKHPDMRAYQCALQELTHYKNGIKCLQGFFSDEEIWSKNENNILQEYLDNFDVGAGIPASTEADLGQQSAFSQDSVTNFWYICLDRGYIVCPECNPLHPCNLEKCRDSQNKPYGAALVRFLRSIDPTGYTPGVDYTVLSDGWGTPYHHIGHLWANILLEETIYEEYIKVCDKYKNVVYGTARAVTVDMFWGRTHEIFPELQGGRECIKEQCIKLDIPKQAFVSVDFRQTQHFDGKDNNTRKTSDDIIREKMLKAPRTVVSQHYVPIFLFPLTTMRGMFISGGRSDVRFPDDVKSGGRYLIAKGGGDSSIRDDGVGSYTFISDFLTDFGYKLEEFASPGGTVVYKNCIYPASIAGASPELNGNRSVFYHLFGTTKHNNLEETKTKLEAKTKGFIKYLPNIEKEIIKQAEHEARQGPAGKSPRTQNDIRMSVRAAASSSSSSTSNN